MQEAVTNAHETSDAFSEETLREQVIFQHAKRAEMKDMFGTLADGQIEMYRAVRFPLPPLPPTHRNSTDPVSQSMQEWERIIPILQRIRVDV